MRVPSPVLLVAVGAFCLVSTLGVQAATGLHPASATTPRFTPPTEYALALGDSFEWGLGATDPATTSAPGVVRQYEAGSIPGLQLVNAACPGESTTNYLKYADSPASECISNQEPQDQFATDFLRAHLGSVAYITMSLGGNDVNDPTNPPTIPTLQADLPAMQANLAIILHNLEAAAPGVPIYGTGYDAPGLANDLFTTVDAPFCSGANGIATCTGLEAAQYGVSGAQTIDGALQQTYDANGAHYVDITGPSGFDITNFTAQGTWQGTQYPQNVVNACVLSWVCTPTANYSFHPNDLGYAAIAALLEQAIRPYLPQPGYDLVGADGGVFVFGGGFYGSLPGIGVDVTNIKDIVPTTADNGYFLVGSDGGVFAFNAPFANSLPGIGVHVNDIVGIVPTLDDQGYFLVGSDGGVFSFNAPFANSLPGIGVHVNDIVGIAATPDDQGYWLVGADGSVYALGDAVSYGNAPAGAVGITMTHDGGGYWIVGSNGAVTAFGDASKFGDLPGLGINVTNIVGIVVSPDSQGYNLFGSDGGVFSFGDQANLGSLPGLGVHVNDVVGAVPT